MSRPLKGILWMLLFLSSATATAKITAKGSYIVIGEYKSLVYYSSFLTALDIGREYSFSEKISFSGEASLYKFWENDYSSIGLGIRPAMEFNLFRGKGQTFFAEVKGGFMFMLPEYPSNAVNFTFQCGLGSDITVGCKHIIRTGIRYSHLSNGRVMEQVNNPSWDGVGVYVGMVLRNKSVR
jgi:hypothetical protein